MRPDMTAAELVRALLDHADMMDRVARINAGLVRASGEPMRDEAGYRNPRLLVGQFWRDNPLKTAALTLHANHTFPETKQAPLFPTEPVFDCG